MVRQATRCAGRWVVVGAVADPAGGTRPAMWSSADGAAWSSVPLRALSYYGHQNVLATVACRDGRLAAVGAKFGGAHGYPRTSNWAQQPDGSLAEVKEPFALFNGSTALNVADMVAGPAGWLVAGNRMSGAAYWTSTAGERFVLHEALPELSSDARGQVFGFAATPVERGWLMVGGIIPAGKGARDPIAWESADGQRWRRLPVPAIDRYDEMQAVAPVPGGAVAVGLRAGAFGSWRYAGSGWSAAATFGATDGPNPPGVVTVSAGPDRLWAVTRAGGRYRLWHADLAAASWREVLAPAAMPAQGDNAVGLTSVADGTILLIDDGRSGRVWISAARR